MNDENTKATETTNSAASALSAGLGGWCAPDGWTVEMPEHTPNCIMISTGNGEWITVDMDKRIFGLGYARPRPWRESMSFSVKGPNWRGRLLSAAVEYLQAEMTPNARLTGPKRPEQEYANGTE